MKLCQNLKNSAIHVFRNIWVQKRRKGGQVGCEAGGSTSVAPSFLARQPYTVAPGVMARQNRARHVLDLGVPRRDGLHLTRHDAWRGNAGLTRRKTWRVRCNLPRRDTSKSSTCLANVGGRRPGATALTCRAMTPGATALA